MGSIEGVWKIESCSRGDTVLLDVSLQGIVIFTQNHYSMTYVSGKSLMKAFARQWQPTDKEKIERFDSLIVNAGTYEISGETLVMHPLIARMPEFMGGRMQCAYHREGDALCLTFVDEYSCKGVQAPWVARGLGLSLALVRVE